MGANYFDPTTAPTLVVGSAFKIAPFSIDPDRTVVTAGTIADIRYVDPTRAVLAQC